MSASKRVTQQAARWFARLHGSEADEPVRGQFEAWLGAHPAHAAEYQALCRVWEDFDAADRSLKLAEGLEAQRVRRRSLAAGLSAALLLGLAAVLAPRGWEVWQNLPQQQLAFSTAPGEVREHALPDGSTLTVGAGSRVELLYTRRERRLELARGEAQFEVRNEANGAARPFTVDAGAARVTVLGTRFVVSRSSEVVDVSVTHGRTKVESPAAALILEAGQSAQVRAGLTPQRVNRDPEAAEDFVRGRIVFRHASLSEIAETLSRYRTIPVRTIATSDGPRIDAVIQASGVEAFLKVLPQIAAVRVQQDVTETRLLPR